MKERYVTITGFKHYYGATPFRIGNLIRCSKEPDNAFDREAIRCSLPGIGKVGYIANSTHTVAGGTDSAGRVYDQVGKRFYIRVCFTTSSKIICRVEPEKDLERLTEELMKQMDDEDDWE